MKVIKLKIKPIRKKHRHASGVNSMTSFWSLDILKFGLVMFLLYSFLLTCKQRTDIFHLDPP